MVTERELAAAQAAWNLAETYLSIYTYTNAAKLATELQNAPTGVFPALDGLSQALESFLASRDIYNGLAKERYDNANTD